MSDLDDLIPPDRQLDLTNCDREPIHVPGAIQPHGALLVVDADSRRILQASANTGQILGLEPQVLLGQQVGEVLGPLADRRLSHVIGTGRLRDWLPLNLSAPNGEQAFELAAHGVGDRVVVEVEPAEPAGDVSPHGFFHALNRAMTGLRSAGSTEELCRLATEEMHHLTGYRRVMVYKFDAEGHGEVVAEHCPATAESFLGLRYPASDIPVQARRLYLMSWLRQIATVDYEPVPLVPDRLPGSVGPLDMSRCSLRSVSPVHLQYLRNMGVTASMSVSLVVDGELWGLMACHHDSPRRLSHHVRGAAELLGQLLSLQLQSLGAQERAVHLAALQEAERALVASMSSAERLVDGVQRSPEDVLAITGADGAVVQLDGLRCEVGVVPSPEVAARIVTACLRREPAAPLAVDELATLDAELAASAEVLETAAGVLCLPITPSAGDHVLWVRGEHRRAVTWAGQPAADLSPGETLTPRASFAQWQEVVRGRSRPWTVEQVDAAAELGTSVPELMLRRVQAELARLALHDPLTGLANRTLLFDRVTHALVRRTDRRHAVLFLDVDRFKLVNDTLGHAEGDELLLQVAERLQRAFRPADTVSRLGGDEFVVFCEDVSVASDRDSSRELDELAGRALSAFAEAFRLAGREHMVSVSIGIAVSEPGVDAGVLLQRADRAMYTAKRSGRNRFALFRPDLDVSRATESEMEQGLHRAVEAGELSLEYQPILHVDGRLSGVEALVRWERPTGRVWPADFLPVAREAGLLPGVEDWVLSEAVRQMSRWQRDSGDGGLASSYVAVNVSVDKLATPGFPAQVAALLESEGLRAGHLCLEVTETDLMVDPERCITAMEELRHLGVRLSIDDFGTGYSSLAYVRRLPASELKIDRALVLDLGRDRRDSALVGSVVRLAHDLEISALVEGVETDRQLLEARRLGCDLVQGFLLGRPVPAEELGAARSPA